MKKDGNITRFSATELKKLRTQGEDRTDLARVRAKAEKELECDIASDPDWRDVPANWYENAEAVIPVQRP